MDTTASRRSSNTSISSLEGPASSMSRPTKFLSQAILIFGLMVAKLLLCNVCNSYISRQRKGSNASSTCLLALVARVDRVDIFRIFVNNRGMFQHLKGGYKSRTREQYNSPLGLQVESNNSSHSVG
jgi:hypothetical protein